MALTSGTRLGSYEIIAPPGAGSMGEVFRARDPVLNRPAMERHSASAHEVSGTQGRAREHASAQAA